MSSPLLRAMNLLAVLGPHAACPATAQNPVRPPAEFVFERQLSELWLHGRESADFKVPTTRPRDHWIFVDSVVRSSGGGRILHMRTRSRGGQEATLVLDADGRVLRNSVEPRDLPSRLLRTAGDTARFRRSELFENSGDGLFSLPDNRIAELSPAFRPPQLQPGVMWLDTIEIAAERGPFSQRLSGERQHRVEGDTVVAGVRYWIVRDSASVIYEERWLRRERTLGAMVTIARQGRGTVRGRYLFDTALGLPVEWHDTTDILGRADLEYPDGRIFTTPMRLERQRYTRILDWSGYQARREELERERRAEYGGIVSYPRNGVEERLARGDVFVRDSLVNAWSVARGVERADLAGVLGRWARGGRGELEDRMLRMALEAGDTSTFVRQTLRELR